MNSKDDQGTGGGKALLMPELFYIMFVMLKGQGKPLPEAVNGVDLGFRP